MTDSNKTAGEQAKEIAARLRDFVDRRGRWMDKAERENLWASVTNLEAMSDG